MEDARCSSDDQKICSEFPKPLPEVNVAHVVDTNGFSKQEKLALRNAWRMIEPFQRQYTYKTYYDFLTKNESLIDYFRVGGKLNLSALHYHGIAVIKTIGKIINNLNRELELRFTLEDTIPLHVELDIDSDVIKELGLAVQDCLLNCPSLKNTKSSTLINGFDRVISLIGKHTCPRNVRLRELSSVTLPDDLSFTDLDKDLNKRRRTAKDKRITFK